MIHVYIYICIYIYVGEHHKFLRNGFHSSHKVCLCCVVQSNRGCNRITFFLEISLWQWLCVCQCSVFVMCVVQSNNNFRQFRYGKVCVCLCCVLHDIASHYIPMHCIAGQCIALPCSAVHCIALDDNSRAEYHVCGLLFGPRYHFLKCFHNDSAWFYVE